MQSTCTMQTGLGLLNTMAEIPGGAQGQVGWGPGQLSCCVAALPTAQGGIGWALRSLPTQPFCDSMNPSLRLSEDKLQIIIVSCCVPECVGH